MLNEYSSDIYSAANIAEVFKELAKVGKGDMARVNEQTDNVMKLAIADKIADKGGLWHII